MSLEGKRGGVYKPEYWVFLMNTFEATIHFLSCVPSCMHHVGFLLSVGTLLDSRGDLGDSFVSLPNLQVHFKDEL